METTLHMLKKTLACLTAAGLLLSFAGCGGKPDAAETAGPAEAVDNTITVKTQTPQMGDLTQATEYIGTVEPDSLVTVLPKMGGTVSRVLVGVGDTVNAGDLLMTLDTTDLSVTLSAQQAQIEVARAAVMSAQATVDQSLGSQFDLSLAQLETSVQQAKNSYASARQGLRDYNDNNSSPADQVAAQRDAARETVDQLTVMEKNLKQALDAAKAAADSNTSDAKAAADYLLAQSRYEEVESNLTAAEKQLSLLNANYNDNDVDTQLRSLRTNVRNAQLAYDSANTIYELTKGDVRNDALKVANTALGQAVASYEAAVKGYEAQAHQLTFAQVTSPISGVIEACNITENQTVNTSTSMFTITNKSTLVTTFYVSEDAAKQLSLGDKVTVESGRSTYNATITEIGTMVDSTGLFKVKASLDDGGLMSGVSVKVTASTAKAQGLLIPQSAIYYENGAGYVYVDVDGKAVKTPIETGVSNNDFAEVLSGVDASSQVIVTWNPNLRDGVEISASPMDESLSSESAATSSETSSSEAASSDAASTGDEASKTVSTDPASSEGNSQSLAESAGEESK